MIAFSLAGLSAAIFALASSFDTVFERLDRVRVLRLVEEHGGFGTAKLLWLFEHRAKARDTLLVVRLSAAVVFTGLVVYATGVHASTRSLAGVLVAAGVFVSLLAAVARLVALTYRETFGRLAAPAALVLVKLFRPVAVVVIGAARLFVAGARDLSSPYASDEELNRLTHDDEPVDDTIEPEERAMIRSIFELGDRRVREIMVPRPDMVSVPSDVTITGLLDSLINDGFSRLPVHDANDADRIVGVMYFKDVFAKIVSDPTFTAWHELLRPPAFVPETKRVDDLLRELQAGAVHLVFVVDEYGELVGLVTIEDLLEEIVGEIVDEYDEEVQLVAQLSDSVWQVDGRMTVNDFREQFALDLPVDDSYDTVGGMVFAMLGELPTGGEQIQLDTFTLTVEQVQGRRVGQVRLEQHDPQESHSDEHEG